MGLVLVVLTYLLVAVILFFVGPFLHYWVTKKLLGFQNTAIKKYVLFWLMFGLINILYGYLFKQFMGTADSQETALVLMKFTINLGFLFTIIMQTLITMWVFKESFIQSLKASVFFGILISICFAVLVVLIFSIGSAAWLGIS